MTHKHAEFFRAIADGESLESWECALHSDDSFCMVDNYVSAIAKWPDAWKLRRKQTTHVVNGFIVPAPLRVAPPDGVSYFISYPNVGAFYEEDSWSNDYLDKRWLERGLIHQTKEAAIANAKAMCGIDPEAE